jgi:hypothetical protein
VLPHSRAFFSTYSSGTALALQLILLDTWVNAAQCRPLLRHGYLHRRSFYLGMRFAFQTNPMPNLKIE